MPKELYKELHDLFSLKNSVEKILSLQLNIEKRLTGLERQLEKLHKTPSGKPDLPKSARKARGRKRKAQTPLTDVIIQVMREKKGPISVNELADAISKGKLFTSKAKNFKNNLRVILYRNNKDLFNLASRGMFELAEGSAEKKVAAKKSVKPKAKARTKKSTTKKRAKKKVAAKKKTTAKKTGKKKTAAKKTVKKKAPAKKKASKRKVSAKKASKK